MSAAASILFRRCVFLASRNSKPRSMTGRPSLRSDSSRRMSSSPNARAMGNSRSFTQRRDLGNAAPRISTMKVGSLVEDTHQHRAQRAYRTHMLKAIVVISIVVLLVIAAFAVYWSPLFSIKQVTVSGVEHLTSDEMTQLANVPSDTTLLRVDTDTIKQRIMLDAWVADVEVQRVFPDTLNLIVTEREMGATVEVTLEDGSSTELWALATDGMWLCVIPDEDSEAAQSVASKIFEDAESVLSITNVGAGISAEVGTYCTDETIINALDVVTGLTTELKDQVVTVSASSAESTKLTLESGVEIDFGVAEDIREKERICLQLLEDYAGEIAYINVRVADSPTWRAA